MSEEPRRSRPKPGTKSGNQGKAKRAGKGASQGMAVPWGRIILWSCIALAAILAFVEFQGRQAYESSWSALDARVAAATDEKPLLAADVAALLPGKTPQTQVNLPGEIAVGEAIRYDEYVWSSLNPALSRKARVFYNKFGEVVKIDRGG